MELVDPIHKGTVVVGTHHFWSALQVTGALLRLKGTAADSPWAQACEKLRLPGTWCGSDAVVPYFMAGAVVALFAATVLAGVPPALRAARINPVDTLRAE